MDEGPWTLNPVQMTPATEGWRVSMYSLVDGERIDDAVFPIVGWVLLEELSGDQSLRSPDDGYVPHRYIEPAFVVEGDVTWPSAFRRNLPTTSTPVALFDIVEP